MCADKQLRELCGDAYFHVGNAYLSDPEGPMYRGAPGVDLVLPILFTAGMTLVDTLDGVIMHHAYAWAFASPVRKVYYNLTITIISIAVAFLVGGLGLIGLAAEAFPGNSGLLGRIAAIDIENLGYVIVAVLVVTWLAASAYWRIAKIEVRYQMMAVAPLTPEFTVAGDSPRRHRSAKTDAL